jgi:hypothetical protein
MVSFVGQRAREARIGGVGRVFGYARGRLSGSKRTFELAAFELASLCAFVGLLAGWAWRLRVEDLASAWVVAGGLLTASVLADLGSGLVHWFADTWGSQDWPIVGRALFAPFREHHRDPKAITRHGFIETNGASAAVALPLVGAAWLLQGLPTWWALYLGVVLAGTATLGVLTNSIHRWAHSDRVPGLVAFMQRRGLILSPAVHDLHHVAPHTTHYCITHGWLNPLLSRVQFFRALERVISRVTGLVPRAEDARSCAPPRSTVPSGRSPAG